MSPRRLIAALHAARQSHGWWRQSPRPQRTKRFRVRISALVALALLATIALPVSGEAQAQTSYSAAASHVIDTNDSNQRVILAVQSNGTIGVRRDMGSGWSAFYDLGTGNWQTASAAILGNGDIHVVAVNLANELHTKVWSADGSWGDMSLVATGVATSTAPSIAANASELALATVRTNGRLETRRYNGSWSSAKDHWGNWVHVDIDLADDGDLWFIGTKNDNSLRVRKHLAGESWSGIALMGESTWSLSTPPSISANSSDVILSAVKTDGRLYTRRQINRQWQDFVKHGANQWAATDVALADDGRAWLVATKDFGRLYTHESPAAGAWNPWKHHGQDTWSTTATPSIALKNNGRPTWVAVKANGYLYARSKFATNWSGWLNMRNAPWETTAEPDTTAPYWTDPSISIQGLSRWDLTVEWGDIDDPTATFEVELTNDAGDFVLEVAQPFDDQLTVDTFMIPFAAGGTIDIEVSAVDSSGNRSDRLATTAEIPTLAATPGGSSTSGDSPVIIDDGAANFGAGPLCGSHTSTLDVDFKYPFPLGVLTHKVGSMTFTSRVCWEDGLFVTNSQSQHRQCDKHGPFALALRINEEESFVPANAAELTKSFRCEIVRQAPVGGIELQTGDEMRIEHRFYFNPDGEAWVRIQMWPEE